MDILSKIRWHYLEHSHTTPAIYSSWIAWLKEYVGDEGIGWRWNDSGGHLFIGFRKRVDACAFKLKFVIYD